MNAYAPIIIEADGKLYPYFNEILAKIAVVENTRAGLPPDAVYKLEPDGYGFRYSAVDAVDFVTPKEVSPNVETLDLVA